MAIEAHAKRLDSANQEEGIEGTEHRTHGILIECELFCDFFIVGHCKASHHIAMAAQVLGRRMHHDVGAKFQRTLQIRRHEGVIDNGQNSMLLGDGSDASQVRHGQERVRRAFDKEGLHVGRHFGIERRQVGGIFDRIGNAEVFEYLVQNAEGSAINIARDNNAVALLKQRKHRRGSRHAATKSKACHTAFEISDQCFERCTRGVTRAGIFPTGIFTKARLLIGGSLVNGHIDGSRDLVTVDAAVDEFRFDIFRS